MGTLKPPQSLPWTPPGPSENLEDELLDVENLYFSAPRQLTTQKISENISLGQPPRLRKNYVKI